ncbi:IS66 family transposase [Shigella flexneri]
MLPAAVSAGRGASWLCMTDGKLHADDTRVAGTAPGDQRRSRAVVGVCRDDRDAGSALAPAVWFAYSRTEASIPQTDLACFSGVLQADASPGSTSCIAMVG